MTRPIRLLTFLFPIYGPMSLLYFPRHFSSLSCHAPQPLTFFSQHSCHCTSATPFSRSFLPQFIASSQDPASSHNPASSQDPAATRSFSAAVRPFPAAVFFPFLSKNNYFTFRFLPLFHYQKVGRIRRNSPLSCQL